MLSPSLAPALLLFSALLARAADAPAPPAPLYGESLRPQFHFTARQWTKYHLEPQQHEEGWMNDPNGLIYYAGQYHFFCQRWATCWLHATSKDLLHWTEFPPPIWETSPGSGVQSGTAVIDWKNTSGLSPDPGNPPFLCFWPTWDNQTQNISYSLDHGRTFKPYEKNPVLRHGERDPKVFWYEPTQSWVMFLYDNETYRIFTSPNLLAWTDTGNTLPNSHECPDVCQLPVDGDSARQQWICIRGNGKYSLGDFDGRKFTETSPQITSDAGPNFYATQTWNEMPNGRRVQIAWMTGGNYPGMPFNQQMSFPCELSLRTTPAGIRLFREPIAELAHLHGNETDLPARRFQDGESATVVSTGESLHVQAEVNIPAGSTLTLHLCGAQVVLGHDSMANDRQVTTTKPLHDVEILVDRTSLEVFGNHGEVSISRCILPKDEGVTIQAHGPATLDSLKLWEVKSVWPTTLAGPPRTP